MRSRAATVAIGTALLLGAASSGPAAGHERDVLTPNQVGPIQMRQTTVAEMKDIFGEPRSRKVKQVGCFKVVQLRWNGIQTFHYKSEKKIVDVRVRSDQVEATAGAYRFHTKRDLRVGDTEQRLRELYPNRKPMTHPNGGHVHYRLAGDYDKVLAKVVDGVVTELESAPYEYC